MKKILTIITALTLAAGAAYAGCGKKQTDAGELKNYDADSKAITVVVDDKKVKLTVTPSTKATGKDGSDAKIEDLVGKNVKVVSEHKKVDSISES